MSITQTIVNGSQTAISVGGGNFLTQSGAVARHTFHRSLVLAEGESADAWREVTPAQKAQIEAEDAAWMAPSQVFIDMWNDAAKANPNNNYGRKKRGEYAPENAPDAQHPFRLYDVWLTYEEAVAIYNWRVADQRIPLAYAFSYYPWRAVMPLYRFRGSESLDGVFSNAVNLEYVDFYAYVTSAIGAFSGCRKLRKIDGHFSSAGLSAAKVDGMFRGCEALEEVRLYYFPSISFADSPNLSLASVEHYVANTSGSADKPKALTLHPTAYARVTDELFETAASKNITIASA